MANFYIVMDMDTAWGVGKTKEQAIQNATQRVITHYNIREAPLDEMERIMGRRYTLKLNVTSRREVWHEGSGYYLEPITLMEWDDKLVDADSLALARLVWEQRERIYIVPIQCIVDANHPRPVVRVARWIIAKHGTGLPIELVAASYACNAAKKASREEIEYHLNALVAAHARFNYVIALGRAMSIARRFYDE